MATYTFEKNQESIEVIPEDFQKMLNDGYVSIELNHDDLVEFLDFGYSPEQIILFFENGLTLADLPDFINTSMDSSTIEELLEYGLDSANELIEKGFSIDDAIKLSVESIFADDIPDFLDSDNSVYTIIEWVELKNKHNHLDDDILEAAYRLDIDPEYVDDAYLGQYNSLGDYAKEFAKQCMDLDNMGDLVRFIDWDAYGESLQVNEENGYYFRTDY